MQKRRAGGKQAYESYNCQIEGCAMFGMYYLGRTSTKIYMCSKHRNEFHKMGVVEANRILKNAVPLRVSKL